MTPQEMADKLLGGYTQEELQKAFNKITNKTNWKFALKGRIKKSELAITNHAAIFFAGSPLQVLRDLGDEIIVIGDGYYNRIGS